MTKRVPCDAHAQCYKRAQLLVVISKTWARVPEHTILANFPKLRKAKTQVIVPALSCTGAPDVWKLFPVQENNSPVGRRRLRCTVTTLEFKRKPAVLHHWLQTPLLFASFKLNSCRRRPPWNAGLLGLFWILTSDGRALVLSVSMRDDDYLGNRWLSTKDATLILCKVVFQWQTAV